MFLVAVFNVILCFFDYLKLVFAVFVLAIQSKHRNGILENH